jgi:L-fucose isomerase-like protein
VISSSDFNELEPYVRIMDAMRRLKQSKIICIRPKTEKDDRIKKMEDKYGVEIKLMDYSRINQILNGISDKDGEKEAEKFINNAVKIVEPSRADIVLANKFYLAVKNLLNEEKANTITIDCLGGFNRGDLKAYPCVAWSRLNDEGLTGVCEADLDSTLTSLMLKFYTGGKPGFVTDPFFDTRFNTIVHAHCVSATKMDGLSGESLPYIIRTHMEDNKGVSVQVLMREGQIITSTKIINADTMLVSTARIIDNSDKNRGCRTKFNCKIIDPETGEELSADRYLHNWTGMIHRVVFYGNLVEDIQKMGRFMGFNVVREV